MRHYSQLIAASVLLGVCATPLAIASGDPGAQRARAHQESTSADNPCTMQASWSALIASGSPGESTPHAALSTFLDERLAANLGFSPPSTDPQLVKRSDSQATFDWRAVDGSVVASVSLVNEGNGWIVNGGSGCA